MVFTSSGFPPSKDLRASQRDEADATECETELMRSGRSPAKTLVIYEFSRPVHGKTIGKPEENHRKTIGKPE